MKIKYGEKIYIAHLNAFGHLVSEDGKIIFAMKNGILLDGCEKVEEE